MVRSLYLCRHGQDEDNVNGLLNGHRDQPLSTLGREQASLVSALVKEKYSHIDVVLASPLQRAHCTAKAIAEGLGLEARVEPLLIERNFGVLTGQPLADIERVAGDKILKTEKVTYFLEVDGAETFPVLRERAAEVLKYVRDNFDGRNVLMVCHGDIGKMIRAVHDDLTWEEGLLTPFIANTELIELKAPVA